MILNSCLIEILKCTVVNRQLCTVIIFNRIQTSREGTIIDSQRRFFLSLVVVVCSTIVVTIRNKAGESAQLAIPLRCQHVYTFVNGHITNILDGVIGVTARRTITFTIFLSTVKSTSV